MPLVFEPVACVLTAQLTRFVSPVSPLAMTLISLPQALVLVAVLVELYAEAVLLVVLPVTYVARGVLPLLALDASVFLSLLLLHPVHRPVRAVLLRLVVRATHTNGH